MRLELICVVFFTRPPAHEYKPVFIQGLESGYHAPIPKVLIKPGDQNSDKAYRCKCSYPALFLESIEAFHFFGDNKN